MFNSEIKTSEHLKFYNDEDDAELNNMTEPQLRNIYVSFKKHDAEYQEQRERNLFYNQESANADYQYWGEQASWSIVECTTLCRKNIITTSCSNIERIKQQNKVLLVQDTTTLNFSGQHKRTDIDPINHDKHRGILLHPTIAVTPERLCLGVIDTYHFTEEEWKAAYMIMHHKKPPKKPITLSKMLNLIAQFGGYLNRKNDGKPGPTAIWIWLQRLRDFIRAKNVYDGIGIKNLWVMMCKFGVRS